MNMPLRKTLKHHPTGDLYSLRFEQVGRVFQVFVESHPPPGNTFGAVESHILSGNKLCFTEKPESFDRALALSISWIEYYSELIRTGNTTQRSKRVHING
jgi:hypothetical protein